MPDLIIVSPREQGGMNYIYIMEKKEYLSPELKEMKFDVESLLSIVSGENAQCPTDCPSDTTTCPDDNCPDDI